MRIIFTFILLLAYAAGAQSWTTNFAPVAVSIDGIRLDCIGLSIATNMTASGTVGVSCLNGTSVVSRSSIRVDSADVSNILARCGTTLPDLGNLLLVVAGYPPDSDFVRRADILVDRRVGHARIVVAMSSGARRTLLESDVDAAMLGAGLRVSVFQAAFLEFAQSHLR